MNLFEILDYIFNPFFLAGANFCTFGVLLAYGTLTTNPLVSYASFGFFISGASITVLAVVGKWVNSQEYESEQPKETIKEGVKYGVQASQNKVQTSIEI
jgi:hypothetical protein